MLACLATCALGASRATAQELPDAATARCVRAAVRLQVELTGPGGRNGTSTGSGTLFDPRGYVLTNFHVVGRTRWSAGGLPGSLLGQRVEIAMVDTAREVARTRWIGRVVRGDVRLDLAIVRIIAQADGSPVPEGTVFPTVELATTEGMQPGASLWAFGFPLGVRTINVTGGRTTGFQMNTRGDVAWIRTDAEFNPGNSGGMLVDRRGRLVAIPTAVVSGDDTLEPIELARPAERVPRAWLDSLASGSLEDTVITGIEALSSGVEATATAVGDAGGLGTEPEMQFFSLPSGRPATLHTTPQVPVALVSERGILREGRGQLAVLPRDPSSAMVAVLLPRPSDGSPTEARLRIDVAGPGGGAMLGQSLAVQGVTARGAVVDGRTGRPVSGIVFVARPGVDPSSAAQLFLSGRLSPQELDGMLLARSQSDSSGAYELRGLTPGTHATLVVARGYRPTLVQVAIPADASLVTLGPIQVLP